MKEAEFKKSVLKRIFKIINGSTPKSDITSYWDGDVVWVTPEDLGKLQGGAISTSRRRITREGLANSGASLVPAESIILSTRAPIGNVALAEVPLCTNQGCKALVQRSREVVPRYFLYQVQSLKRELNVLGNGTTFLELSADKLGQVELFAPSPERQRIVADFLDRETAEADALVAKYERLIELLEEKRVALITQAVTKGLELNVTTSESGIEWVGMIPYRWGISRLRFLCTIGTGGRDTVDAVDDGDFPFFVRSQTIERIDSHAYDCEAILTAGDGVGVGKVFHHFTGKFNAHQRVYILSSFKNVVGRFLYYYLKTNFYKVALEGGAKSTVDSLRMPVFLNFPVTLPPVEEQMRIVSYVEEQSSAIDALINLARKATDFLKERRSALITAAVTGQIDVSTYRSKQQPVEVSA